jgi:hypothetical protein
VHVRAVTSAVGSSNVKVLQNAETINSQTLITYENTVWLSAARVCDCALMHLQYQNGTNMIGQENDEFNQQQAADLLSFNQDYCNLIFQVRERACV